jgi:hypothetical protein
MKRYVSLLSVIVIISGLLCSCDISYKGHWSKTDKEKFRKEMNSVEELNKVQSDKSQIIECYLEKCQANYNSYATADKDEMGCKRLAKDCFREVLSAGSIRGNWSDKDKRRFRNDMNNVEELSNFGEEKIKFIECYLEKCENYYLWSKL